MPSHVLLRCSWQFKDADPKNQAVINPCFRRQTNFDPTSSLEAQALVDDLATALQAWQPGTNRNITVKAYDLEGAAPNYPLAVKTLNSGNFVPVSCPPQVAVALSYYGARNIPRERGRLFVPLFLIDTSGSGAGLESVGTTTSAKVQSLVPIFANLGGANVDWIVWSRVASKATRVQNWWVDSSWDVIRSRKLKALSRATGTTSG